MELPRFVDVALDRLVVPGYSRLGFAARSAGWRDLPGGALGGRTVVVTGANSGLGKATVSGLARLGATVEMVVRDEGRGESARGEILAEQPDADVRVARCDLSSLADVRRYAGEVRDREPALFGLVHNAGVLPPERSETGEGHELTLATHVLCPFALTRELRPVLRAGASPTAPSRVVFVSSGGMYTASMHVDDPEFRDGTYSGGAAYARTKRMQVVLSELLADDLASDGVVVHSMHPGWADTPGVQESLPRFRALTRPVLRDDAQGADTSVWLSAVDPAPPTGKFWHDRVERPTSLLPTTRPSPDVRARAWQWLHEAAGLA